MQSDQDAGSRTERNASGNGRIMPNGVARDAYCPGNGEGMTIASDVIGVWRLRSYHLEVQQTRERIEPYGAQPKGVLMIHPEGRVVVVMTPGEQQRPATEADQAQAFQRLIAYSGIYRVEPPTRFVTTVDVAWFEPWVGSEQTRDFVVRGDTLDIVSMPTCTPLTGDALVVGVLSWVRETALER
jgi:hypothetical protein